MFNVGPMEMLVLFVVALVLFGPDRLPSLVRDVARVLRTMRDMAQGARAQLNELRPELDGLADMNPLNELKDVDLRSLNPRTALTRMLLEDPEPATPTQSTRSDAAAPPASSPERAPSAPAAYRDDVT